MAEQYDRNVYVQLMSTLGHGYPLWHQDYDSKAPPTRVGDLGYITDDGDFAYLFNVFADASDLSNSGRIPPDFIPLTELPEPAVEQRLEMYKKNAVLTTHSGSNGRDETPVRDKFEVGRGYEFTCSAAQAAILVLPDGGERYDSTFPHLLEECAAANAHRWYKYFNDAGQQLQIRNGMLYLVTGFDKCHSWGNAYYSCRSKSPSNSLKFSTGSTTTTTTGLDGPMQYSWDVPQYVHTKSHCTGMPGSPVNQTIFLRGYSISVRPDPSQGLDVGQPTTSGQSTEGPKRRRRQSFHNSDVNKLNTDIPYSLANRQTNVPVQTSEQYKIINPSVLINNHILEHFPGAQVALTHDGHWMGMAGGDQNPLDAQFASYAIEKKLLSVREHVSVRNAWVAKPTALNDEPSMPIENRSTFALIIGIDKYEQEEYNLNAAVADANRFEDFLLKRLQTPKEHIISLRNDQATRKSIIGGFRSLIHDQRISPGKSAIIIYYAGHGAQTSKPAEWKDWQTPNNDIEILCPTDTRMDDKNNNGVDGIPDRTISVLLQELATAKGNNITLILDCCHAAGINRAMQPKNAKARRILNPPPLSDDCDSTIYFRVSSGTTIESGFSGSLWDSHVLLAACKRHESAWEVGERGVFTRALLKTLDEKPVHEWTYQSLMDRLVMSLENPNQTPHLEGKHTLRRLFNCSDEPADNSLIPCFHELGEPRLVLHAGAPNGITVGSTFEIFETNLSDLEHPLAIATVSKVEAFKASLLVPPDSDFRRANTNCLVYARLREDPSTNFHIYCDNSKLLTQIIQADREPRFTVHVTAVQTRDEAHLCLTVEDSSVFFDRGNKINLFNPIIGFPSRFPHGTQVGDIARIRTIISRFAHFTAQLSLPRPLPVTNLISIEINELQRKGRSLTPVDENSRLVTNDNMPIEFFVDKSLSQDQQPRYGFTIRNESNIDLYVYLFFFDGTSFEIVALYSGMLMSRGHTEEQGAVDIRPSRDAILNLGYGDSSMDPFVFTLPEKQDVDVCFFKLIVTSEPVGLHSISQSSPFSDLTPRGISNVSPSSDLPGSWASIVIPVVQKTVEAVDNLSPKTEFSAKSVLKTAQTVDDPSPKTEPSEKSISETHQAVVNPSPKIKSLGKSDSRTDEVVDNLSPKTESSAKSVLKTAQTVDDPSPKTEPSEKSISETHQAVVNPSPKIKSLGKSDSKTAETVDDPSPKTEPSEKSISCRAPGNGNWLKKFKAFFCKVLCMTCH